MIKNLVISYDYGEISYELDIPTPYLCNDTPRNLAAAFAELIQRSDANKVAVMNHLCYYLQENLNEQGILRQGLQADKD